MAEALEIGAAFAEGADKFSQNFFAAMNATKKFKEDKRINDITMKQKEMEIQKMSDDFDPERKQKALEMHNLNVKSQQSLINLQEAKLKAVTQKTRQQMQSSDLAMKVLQAANQKDLGVSASRQTYTKKERPLTEMEIALEYQKANQKPKTESTPWWDVFRGKKTSGALELIQWAEDQGIGSAAVQNTTSNPDDLPDSSQYDEGDLIVDDNDKGWIIVNGQWIEE